MTNLKQAEQFILTKLNECCLFTHEDYAEGIPSGYAESIFHIWDKQAIREKKILRLINKENEMAFKPGKNSLYLFEQDYKNNYFCYSYSKIYLVLKEKYALNEQQINDLFKDILEQADKWKQLTPLLIADIDKLNLNEYNWKQIIQNEF